MLLIALDVQSILVCCNRPESVFLFLLLRSLNKKSQLLQLKKKNVPSARPQGQIGTINCPSQQRLRPHSTPHSIKSVLRFFLSSLSSLKPRPCKVHFVIGERNIFCLFHLPSLRILPSLFLFFHLAKDRSAFLPPPSPIVQPPPPFLRTLWDLAPFLFTLFMFFLPSYYPYTSLFTNTSHHV